MVQSRKSENHGYWNYAQHFTYNAAGAVTSMQLGNNRWESTIFNSRLQPTQIALGTVQNGTDKLKLEYGYGTTANNGNVLSQKITVKRPSQSDLVFDQLYTYDSLNRITSAEEKTGTTVNWNQTYTFDRYGNRNFNENLTTTLPKGCLDGSNPVMCEADREIFNPDLNPANNRMAAGQGWAYDTAGNVITDAEGRQFSYDAENKQKEVKDSLNQTIGQYFFDGDGKRVKKYVPSTGEVTVFVYNAGGSLVAEYSTIVETQNPKVQYLTADHLGSPRINTDQNGNVTSRTDYMPYGEEIIGLGGRSPNDNYVKNNVRQGFTGYETDTETGLEFAQARVYSNQIGRFHSPDPLGDSADLRKPQSINRYVYVLNSPLVLVDPTGLIWVNPAGCSGETCQATWIDDDEWNSYSDEQRKPYVVVTKLTYNSVTGYQVILDPNGPSEANPSGWRFGGPNTEDADLGTAVGGIVARRAAAAGTAALLDGPLPFGEVIGGGILVFTVGTVIYTVVIYEGPHSLPSIDPNIYAKSRERRLIEHIADTFGVPYDLLSDEIHDYKESTGRGGADNLTKEQIEQIAKEIADRLKGKDN